MPDSDRKDILIVDDEELICFVLTHLLRVHGFSSRKAARGDEALRLIADRRPDLIIMDIRMPGMSGFEVLERIRQHDPHTPVILMTALSSVRDAVDAMKATAFDYIAKPFDNDAMIATVHRALRAAEELRAAAAAAPPAEEPLHAAFASMGRSLAVRRLAREAVRLAAGDNPVMIVGEVGTGKRHVAGLLHTLSGRDGAFLHIDCTGADEMLLRGELYGRVGDAPDAGMFERSAGGTLLLGEVSDIPWNYQDEIAGDLHERRCTRPGQTGPIPITARILLSATLTPERGIDGNHLSARFRELYGEAVLHVPPLRERREDIPMLASDFIAEANGEFGGNIAGIDADALELLVAYDWPGNLQQLRSVLRRATLTAKERIGAGDIELPLRSREVQAVSLTQDAAARAEAVATSLKDQVRRHVADIERQLIFETLQKTGWNKAKASRLLGVTYKTLLKKVSEFGLERG